MDDGDSLEELVCWGVRSDVLREYAMNDDPLYGATLLAEQLLSHVEDL